MFVWSRCLVHTHCTDRQSGHRPLKNGLQYASVAVRNEMVVATNTDRMPQHHQTVPVCSVHIKPSACSAPLLPAVHNCAELCAQGSCVLLLLLVLIIAILITFRDVLLTCSQQTPCTNRVSSNSICTCRMMKEPFQQGADMCMCL